MTKYPIPRKDDLFLPIYVDLITSEPRQVNLTGKNYTFSILYYTPLVVNLYLLFYNTFIYRIYAILPYLLNTEWDGATFFVCLSTECRTHRLLAPRRVSSYWAIAQN